MSEKRHRVLSALGPDRPGLVSEVTHYLTERATNIEDSRMAVLGEEFGIMVLISGPPDALLLIESELGMLSEQTGLELLLHATEGPRVASARNARAYHITASALDHEGIVRAVSGVLYRLGANITSLVTTAYNAPETGIPLFHLEAQVEAPESVDLTRLNAALEEVERAENLELEVVSLPD